MWHGLPQRQCTRTIPSFTMLLFKASQSSQLNAALGILLMCQTAASFNF